ncbi:MAG TPA: riboflavin kinase [Candidatus Saccharimonadales bacterium]|nr:riboflavin kinase [Candidatus Saccharimonadales bacterium]
MKANGIVIRHKRNGTKFGYPTANIVFEDKSFSGLFVGNTKLLSTDDEKVKQTFAGRELPSIIFIGTAETLDETEHRLESHILDFPLIDLYDSEIEITVLDKLRDNRKFESVELLIEQMKKDERDARRWFAKENLR